MAITFPRIFANMTTVLLSYFDENFAAINQQLGDKAGANGLASLNGSSLVVQNPASKGAANGIAELDSSSRLVQPANKISDGTNLVHCKAFNIGDWNMDANATVLVAHGLDYTKILSVSGVVRDDADVVYYALPHVSAPGSTDFDMGIWATYDSTDITLTRKAASQFDSTNFNATAFNRGFILVWYKE